MRLHTTPATKTDMPTSVETPDFTAGIPGQPDHGGGVFSVLGMGMTSLLAALLLILIAVSVFPSQQTIASLAAYLPLQSVLQMFAIVVSILIFAVGWVAYSRERVGNSVLLSCAFLAVGLMDFAYTMSYPGMPDFVTPSSEGKALDFWLAARGLAACALLWAAVRPWRPFASLQTRYWLLIAALGLTALVYWLVLSFESALPATFVPGQGPTPFKTGAEYTLIAVYVLAAAFFFVRLRIERADYLRRLFTACCVIILSELFFAFYGDVADINNLPGHIYDAIAYLLVYQALSVRGTVEPYQRLQQSRQPRRTTMERRRKGLASDWWRVGLSPDWYREQDGAAAQAMLSAIVENSNAAIVGCALDATIVSWNDAAEQMFGWSASEAIGQPITIITPQQLHGLLQPLFEQAARGEPVGQVESSYLRRDGTCIDTAGTLVAIRDANGEPVFFTLTLWDITQQKQLEREVRKTNALTELLEVLARAANEAATPEAALQSCLERICDYGHWVLGRIGTFAPGEPKGVPQSFWRCPQPARFDEFMRISNSLDYSLHSGKFTDVVLREKKVVWESDFAAVYESGRLASAAKCGIRSGFAFPVVADGEVLAILEFFADEVRAPDTAFLDAINSVVSQLARVIEREHAGQKLLESQKQFEQLAAHIPQAFWITDMQRKELIYLSLAHERIYGQRFSSLQSVWPGWKEAVHAEDRERVLAAYREMGSRGLDEQFRILQPDGAMRWVHARGFPVRDANGTVYRVVGTVEDITERVHSEEALRKSEQQVRAITANLPGAVFQFRISPAGEYSFPYLSEGILDLTEIRHADAIRDHTLLFALIEPEHLPAVIASIERARTTLEPWSCEWSIRTQSGRTKWIRGRAITTRRDDGTVLGDGILTDITVEKQAEQEIARLNQSLEQRVAERTRQLEATNKELEAFSYSVSHDLRAPLRGIDGFSQILLQKYAGQLDATGSDYLQRIRRASLRMAELIDDLLQLSRVSRSQIKIERVDVSRLARSILAELQEREPERKVVTEVQDGIELNADAHLLKIVLENLLGNAWKFTGKGEAARIRFGAREQDGEQVVFVEDNGAGFDMKYAHKLFGAFQRLHSAAQFEGTGIGLATVQRILNLHGGRIWADSTPGEYTSFQFVIPPAGGGDAATPRL